MDRVFVLDRVTERHPDVSKEDARAAWQHCIANIPRIDADPDEYAAIGYDDRSRLLELVVLRTDAGDWLIIHAQTPPQERILRELGYGRRKQ